MADAAARRRVTVAVGLINGTSKTGSLVEFDPAAEEIHLETATRAPGGRLDRVGVMIPTTSASYVAFYREGAAPEPPPEDVLLGETRVYAPGGNSFQVQVPLADLEDPIGFMGRPVSRASLYSQIWFFTPRLSAIEDATPLGELLIQQGLLDIAGLDDAVGVQATDREAPIGQILVEQAVLEETDVEEVVAQPARVRDGKRMRLGEILVEAGLATQAQIGQALAEQRNRRGKRLGQVLVEAGIVTEGALAKTLALKFRVPFIDLDNEDVDLTAAAEIPPGIIKRFRVLPFKSENRVLHVAMADPTAVEALDMLRFSLGKRLQEVVVKPSQLDRYMEELFPKEDPAQREMENMLSALIGAKEEMTVEQGEDTDEDEQVSKREDGTIIRVAYQIILQAWKAGASDIHIEPQGKERPVKIRTRVDGMCSLQRVLPPTYRRPLVARIKILAGLDITERRLPQDGKIQLKLPTHKIELRVATIPTSEGDEDVVLRILAAGGALPMAKLGLSERNFRESQQLVQRPYGLFLVVGPTGSGKTTTLHSMMASINNDERKIWTAEDPVEITQHGLRQVQMKPRIGLTFANAMRAFLRADPDVIMVGEMRDLETAGTAVEASLTGHLVMSTLHTNSAPETITRLVDMGVDPFTFSDALLGVLAQRLARRLCSACKTPYEASASEITELRELYGDHADADEVGVGPVTLWHADGCETCGATGYKGRLGLHELLVADDAVRGLIQQHKPVDAIREAAQAGGMRTLLQDGIYKALQGLTDVRQVLAVCSK